MAHLLGKGLAKYLIEHQDFQLIQWQRSDKTTFYKEEDLWLVRQHWGEIEITRLCTVTDPKGGGIERVKSSLQGYLQHVAMTSVGKIRLKLFLLVPDTLDSSVVDRIRHELISLEGRSLMLSVDIICEETGELWQDKGRKLDQGLTGELLQEFIHKVALLTPVEQEALRVLQLDQIQALEKEAMALSQAYPWATNSLVLVLTIVFLVSVVYAQNLLSLSVDALNSLGAKYGPLIADGEYWRLLTAAFLHGGLIHFMLNIFALYHLGRTVEHIYGYFRFLIVYFVAAFSGNILSFYFLPDTVSVGASGAIFGLFGALLALKWKSPKFFAQSIGSGVISSIVINLVYGVITPGIDNYAHIGGLLGGLAVALLLSLGKENQRFTFKEVLALLLIIAVLVSGTWLGREKEYKSPVYLAEQGQRLLTDGEFQEAIPLLERAVEQDPDNLRYAILLGWALLEEKQYDRAQDLFDLVLAEDANNAAAHYFKAHLYLRKGLINQAYGEAKQAAKLAPEYREAKDLVEQLEVQYKEE